MPAIVGRGSCYTTDMPNLALGDMCDAGPKVKSFRDVSSSESTFSLGSKEDGTTAHQHKFTLGLRAA